MNEATVEIKSLRRILKSYNETQWDDLRHKENVQDLEIIEWRNFSIQEIKEKEKLLTEYIVNMEQLTVEERVLSLRKSVAAGILILDFFEMLPVFIKSNKLLFSMPNICL